MRLAVRLTAGALLAGGLVASLGGLAAPAGAATPSARSHQAAHHHDRGGGSADHAVFVQTDGLGGNAVVAYEQAPDGTLVQARTYPTGGLGGQLAGSVVDHLASQGSLTYDAATNELFAVNAGSDSVSVFTVAGDRLSLRQVVNSGGEFPVSIAARGPFVYVLDALGGGSVQGYVDLFGELLPIPGSNRALGLDPNASPQFVNTPGQVAFTPDGRQLIVTTKANGNDIDVFGVSAFGGLSASPVVNAEPGAVPFAVSFGRSGTLAIAEAGTNAVVTFALSGGGTLTQVSSVSTGQSATCWLAAGRGVYFADNAGSGSVSTIASTAAGELSLAGTTSTDAGTVDAAVSPDGRSLYVQAGAAGIVDEYHVGSGGSLAEVGSVTVPGAAGGEGIVAL